MVNYIKEMQLEGLITVDYVRMQFNMADLFTKGVPREVVNALAPYLLGNNSIKELLAKVYDDAKETKAKKDSMEPRPD